MRRNLFVQVLALFAIVVVACVVLFQVLGAVDRASGDGKDS